MNPFNQISISWNSFFIFVTFSYSDRFVICFIFFFFIFRDSKNLFMTCNNVVIVVYTSKTIISFLASCLPLNKNHVWLVHLWITWFRWLHGSMKIKACVIRKFYWTKRNFYCVPFSALTMYTHLVNFWRYICFILYTGIFVWGRGCLIWGVKA